MSDSGESHIETLKIEQRKLLRNSNGHNFSHGCPIQANHVDKGSSRCFDDAKRSHVSQSFIQDKAIKDIQDG